MLHTATPSPAAVDTSAVDDYVRRGLAHHWVANQQYADLAEPDGFKVFVKGEGIWLWDLKGRKLLDAISGLWVVNVGHGRTELAEAAARQLRELAYVNTFAFSSMPAVDLATKLAELMPDNLNKSFFVNSGSEAVDTAIRMAKHYQYNIGEKKRYKVLARRGSYHGVTAGALSVNSASYTYRAPVEPLVPGVVFVEGVNCYRCPYEKTYPESEVFCARTIEQTILSERPETIAAFVGEPISMANANYIPPAEYWPTIRALCDKYGILLIADEVINGFGRTGKWWGSQHFDYRADLMTMAKGLSSGYAPIAAIGASDAVAEAFVGDKSRTFTGGITFGSHPMSCAVALANLEILERERLVENARVVGDYLLGRLEGLMDTHPIIGEARGRGLLLALELVKDRATKEPFPESDGLADKLTAALFERGVITRGGNVLYVAPPLVITRAEADDLVSRIDDALGAVERALGLS